MATSDGILAGGGKQRISSPRSESPIQVLSSRQMEGSDESRVRSAVHKLDPSAASYYFRQNDFDSVYAHKNGHIRQLRADCGRMVGNTDISVIVRGRFHPGNALIPERNPKYSKEIFCLTQHPSVPAACDTEKLHISPQTTILTEAQMYLCLPGEPSFSARDLTLGKEGR